MARKIKHQNLWRYTLIKSVVFLYFLLLIARLVQIQIIERKHYVKLAEKQYKHEVQLLPKRGLIYDRNQELLALNAPSASIGVHRRQISQPLKLSHQLSSILSYNQTHLYRELRAGDSFAWLARNVNRSVGEKVKKINQDGLQVRDDTRRSYPHSQVGSQLLGYVDPDGKGLSGIELSFDHVLRGKTGRAMLQRSAKLDLFKQAHYPVLEPTDGLNLILTLDYVYQSIAEEELANSIAETRAESGMVIISNPKTGELLAIASAPGFDPNNYSAFPPASWRLRPITDQFEPGSTFKVPVMAGLLDAGLISPDSMIFCENGTFKLYDNVINDTKKYAWLTARDVVINSSNIGMAKIALKIKRQAIYESIRDFGFGQKTGIGLAGEVSGLLKTPGNWSAMTPAVMAFGHEITVTALQLTSMFNAIANGGLLLKPRIVKTVMEHNYKVVEQVRPEVIRRVISEATAQTMIAIMQDVVKKGTGKNAQIGDLPIAGKTGTARKVKSGSRGYIQDQYIASFGGFFPAHDAKLSIFIMIDNPKGQYYGGEVAAPCFRRILERIIKLESLNSFMKVAENNVDKNSTPKSVIVPNLYYREAAIANQVLAQMELLNESVGAGNIVIGQVPEPGAITQPGAKILLKLAQATPDSSADLKMPAVKGLPVRDALMRLAAAGLEAEVTGSGKVVLQTPAPGSLLKSGQKCQLVCQSDVNLARFISY